MENMHTDVIVYRVKPCWLGLLVGWVTGHTCNILSTFFYLSSFCNFIPVLWRVNLLFSACNQSELPQVTNTSLVNTSRCPVIKETALLLRDLTKWSALYLVNKTIDTFFQSFPANTLIGFTVNNTWHMVRSNLWLLSVKIKQHLTKFSFRM